MTKASGIGSAFFVGTADLSGDTGALSSIESSRGTLDVTGIDKSAPERIMGRKDGTISWLSFWNTDVGAAHLTISALPRTDVQLSYFTGNTVGIAAASMIAKVINYNPNLGADGSLTTTPNAQANGYGLEWGEALTTGKQTFASGTVNGTSVDLGAVSTLFGASAYLHVFSLGSGTPTLILQDSANNSAFSPITGMGFTAITGVVTERKQGATNATVRRYVSVNVTGTYTNLVAAVVFVRYLEAP